MGSKRFPPRIIDVGVSLSNVDRGKFRCGDELNSRASALGRHSATGISGDEDEGHQEAPGHANCFDYTVKMGVSA